MKLKKFKGPVIKISHNAGPSMTTSGLDEELATRVDAVLKANPKAMEDVTIGNAKLRLRKLFGLEVDVRDNTPWKVALAINAHQAAKSEGGTGQ